MAVMGSSIEIINPGVGGSSPSPATKGDHYCDAAEPALLLPA